MLAEAHSGKGYFCFSIEVQMKTKGKMQLGVSIGASRASTTWITKAVLHGIGVC